MNKKSYEADVDRRSGLFFLLGLTIAIGLWYWAIVYEQKEESNDVVLTSYVPDEIEEPPDPTKEPPPPEQAPPPPPEVVEFEEVEEDPEVEIELPDMDDFEAAIDEPEFQEQGVKEAEVFQIVEDMPEFPGGEKAMLKYITSNTTYPSIPKEMGIEERIIIKFVVEKDGSVSNVEVVRGRDKYLKEEAIRVIENMPRWKPGKQRGKPVRVTYTLPVNFKLRR